MKKPLTPTSSASLPNEQSPPERSTLTDQEAITTIDTILSKIPSEKEFEDIRQTFREEGGPDEEIPELMENFFEMMRAMGRGFEGLRLLHSQIENPIEGLTRVCGTFFARHLNTRSPEDQHAYTILHAIRVLLRDKNTAGLEQLAKSAYPFVRPEVQLPEEKEFAQRFIQLLRSLLLTEGALLPSGADFIVKCDTIAAQMLWLRTSDGEQRDHGTLSGVIQAYLSANRTIARYEKPWEKVKKTRRLLKERNDVGYRPRLEEELTDLALHYARGICKIANINKDTIRRNFSEK